MNLPPDDRTTSPYTGWTRTHWEMLADHLLDSLVPYFSPGAARVVLPGRTSQSGAGSDALEGFARSFMLAAFRIAGAQGKDRDALIEPYARGLVAGADRDSPEAWPRLRSRTQPLVEAAAIAVALHESRAWVWDRLDDRGRQAVADWLGDFVGAEPFDNNWRLFQVVGEQFLASVGAPYRQDEIDAGLDRIEDWYLGGGWYTDGDGQNFDYYAGWAMHLYPGLWARMAAATPGATYTDRLDSYRERLRLFLDDAVHLIGTDGAPVHQGRSLTYRMATAAQFWMGALLDATPLSPGTTRRVCSGIARHFTEHGVPDENGLLTLGWYDRFLPATQAYSGPGSPYWASKGFVGLLLPPDHPVWTETEQAAPLDESDQARAMPQPGWLVHATHADGIVRLLNHGSDHAPVEEPEGPEPPADAHYDRLAYSSRTGPDHTDDRVDNHVALVDGDRTSTRGRIRRLGTGSSWHRAWLGSDGSWRIETASVVYAGTEIRCSLVEGPAGCTVRAGGYAVAGESLPRASTGAAEAAVRSRLTSIIRNLYGYDGAGVQTSTGTNAFGRHSATPYLTRSNHPGHPLVLVCAVTLGDEAVPVGVTVEDHVVTVHLPDGSTEQISLGAVHRE